MIVKYLAYEVCPVYLVCINMSAGGYDTLKMCDEIRDKSWLDGVKVTVQYLDRRSWKKKGKERRAKEKNKKKGIQYSRSFKLGS